jgi:hypothetical protein
MPISNSIHHDSHHFQPLGDATSASLSLLETNQSRQSPTEVIDNSTTYKSRPPASLGVVDKTSSTAGEKGLSCERKTITNAGGAHTLVNASGYNRYSIVLDAVYPTIPSIASVCLGRESLSTRSHSKFHYQIHASGKRKRGWNARFPDLCGRRPESGA